MAKRTKKRLRRDESFLGIHFDFHAGPDCRKVGDGVTPKMVEAIVDQVKPDYIQCDCKGHRGLSSYPTRVGYAAPGFVRDQLRIWREVTARRGVALYMHYSGVWDTEALSHHRSWARIDETGKRDKKNTSVFGPYVDKLLIPQLKELCDEYGVDGVWIDGDCWATCQDYGKQVLAAFRRETGIRSIPKKQGDKHFRAFTDFCREGFRNYVRRYVDALHAHDPDFQIASNWAFSSFMPEPVSVDVDFISGDYPLQDSVRAARLEARCMMHQGKPWDLMAWAFCGRWGEKLRSTKTIPQLSQEAAIVLALGGGFQAYFKQNRSGAIHDWTMQLMAGTARFCRERQKLCHKAQSVPQIAILNSTEAYLANNDRVFGPWGGILEPLKGTLNMLVEGQHSVDIVSEHHLEADMHRFGLIVLPETNTLEPAFRKRLAEYVRAGGSLLCLGPAAAKLFRKELDIRFVGAVQESPRWLEHDGWLGGVTTGWQRIKRGRRARAAGTWYAGDDRKTKAETAATITRLGKGRIAAVYGNLGQSYQRDTTTVARDFVSNLVHTLFPKPIATVTGSHAVDVSLMRKDGQLRVNLVNTAGPHADGRVHTYDTIPPVGPLTVALRLPKKPKRIRLLPSGKTLRSIWKKGVATVTVPRLELHEVLVCEVGKEHA